MRGPPTHPANVPVERGRREPGGESPQAGVFPAFVDDRVGDTRPARDLVTVNLEPNCLEDGPEERRLCQDPAMGKKEPQGISCLGLC